MKRAAAGTYPTYKQAAKRQQKKASGGKPRAGYTSVARTRGAAVTGEMKYFDSALTSTNLAVVTTTWVAGTMKNPSTTINLGAAAVATPQCLFAPTVGSALNQRIGRSVLVRKLKIRGTLEQGSRSGAIGAGTADLGTKVRLLLVQDMQTNAAQMTGAALLNDATDATTTIDSFQNPNNFGRFRVLKDKVLNFSNPNFTVGETAAGSYNSYQQGMVKFFKFNVNFKIPVKVQFNATNGGTVADIVDNSFHIVAGVVSADNTNIALSYYSRVAYKE